MSAPPLRLGLVGCGRIASLGYLPAIAATPEVELVAVADPSAERCAALAAAAAADGRPPSTHAGAAELIAGAELEALLVATPAAHHLEAARLAADAALACLVEKPPAPDLAGARELAALDPAPWLGFNRRFDQGLELVDAVPAQGSLELELELCYRRGSWRPHSGGDDALLDIGPHLVDLGLFLAGGGTAEVRRANCRRERAQLELQTDRGPMRVRCATDRSYRERVVVSGPGGRVSSVRGGLRRALAARVAGAPHPLVGSLALQLRACGSAARGADPGVLATAEDGVRAMAAIDAARERAS
jgi:predicted dehydrogenase